LRNKSYRSASTAKKLLLNLEKSLHLRGEEETLKKLNLLRGLEEIQFVELKLLQIYKRCLLFLMAYPDSLQVLEVAKNGLQQLDYNLLKLPAKTLSPLAESGLAGSSMSGVYSFELIRWLVLSTSQSVELDYLEPDAIHPATALAGTFAAAEFELESATYLKPYTWLARAFGTKDKKGVLQRLVKHLSNLPLNGNQKDALFESMRVCISFKCESSFHHLRFRPTPYMHSEKLMKHFDVQNLLLNPLPKPLQLNKDEQKELIFCARKTLFYLNRETDPISNCDETGLEYYELERGFSICLFSSIPERRLPIESYIGFMMFKNQIPISYGGAWLFGKRSLLGINIFESFRGGESGFLFGLLLRTYKQRFSPSQIEVEAYQYGKGNPEGISTGAFWFYYRFGFRPIDEKLKKIADREHAKIQTTKTYKCPKATLVAFTNSNIVLNFELKTKNTADPSILSQFITESINAEFSGDRKAFREWSMFQLKDKFIICN